jgi:hypothetical protein
MEWYTNSSASHVSLPLTPPRQSFGLLQSKLFPTYFSMSTYLSTFMLGHWLYQHPGVSRAMFDPAHLSSGSVVNAWILAAGFLGTSAVNWLIVTPWTSGIMFKRHRLEREEGKSYTDPNASEAMKSLSKQFATAHSVSSLLVSGGLGCAGAIIQH